MQAAWAIPEQVYAGSHGPRQAAAQQLARTVLGCHVIPVPFPHPQRAPSASLVCVEGYRRASSHRCLTLGSHPSVAQMGSCSRPTQCEPCLLWFLPQEGNQNKAGHTVMLGTGTGTSAACDHGAAVVLGRRLGPPFQTQRRKTANSPGDTGVRGTGTRHPRVPWATFC